MTNIEIEINDVCFGISRCILPILCYIIILFRKETQLELAIVIVFDSFKFILVSFPENLQNSTNIYE